jgi:hypothetical protein
MYFHSDSKKKESLGSRFAAAWINLEDSGVCEVSQAQTEQKNAHDLAYMWNVQKTNSERVKLCLPDTGMWGHWNVGQRTQIFNLTGEVFLSFFFFFKEIHL